MLIFGISIGSSFGIPKSGRPEREYFGMLFLELLLNKYIKNVLMIKWVTHHFGINNANLFL